MFETETSDPARLSRVVAGGAGALLLGLALVAFHLLGPFAAGDGHDATTVVSGLFGVFAVVTATRPTYQAAQRLEAL